MLSSSVQHLNSTTIHNDNIEQSVELGTDPLSVDTLPPPPSELRLSDHSFCNVDVKDCYSLDNRQGRRTRGDITPAEPGYVVPSRVRDYPQETSLDNDLHLTEPYIMADKPHNDLNFIANFSDHPKGSLDLRNIVGQTPGDKYEQKLNSLNNIPSVYPDLPSPSSGCSSSSYKSAQGDDVPSSSHPFRHNSQRINPFNDKDLRKTRSSSPTINSHNRAYTNTISAQPVDYYSGFDTFTTRPQRLEPDRYSHHPGALKPRQIKTHGQGSQEQNTDIDVVTVIRGTFNNAVQYIGSLAGNNFDTSSSICFLGKIYFGKHQHEGRRLDTESIEDHVGSFNDFLVDFQSRVWVTYRRGFPALDGTSLISDTGWGCMLRTGQMMLATALQIHCFGREWRRNRSCHRTEFKELVRHFGDSLDYPFSLHNLLKIGLEHLNKPYGEWYGPSTVAYVLRVCVDYAKDKPMTSSMINIRNFVVFTATDCMLFKQDIIDTALGGQNTTPGLYTQWKKMLILISVRMGADELNPSYRSAIQAFLASSMCIGMMGGRKRHSLYFVGFQGSKLIHYDPHTCQAVLKMRQDFSTESYICAKPRKMSFSKMDPSCTFGFYLQSAQDLDKLIHLSQSVGEQKVFEILDGTKDDYLSMVHDPAIKAYRLNEDMYEAEDYSISDIASLVGSDFEYLE